MLDPLTAENKTGRKELEHRKKAFGRNSNLPLILSSSPRNPPRGDAKIFFPDYKVDDITPSSHRASKMHDYAMLEIGNFKKQ